MRGLLRQPILHAALCLPLLTAIALSSSFAIAETGLHRVLFPLTAGALALYLAYLVRLSSLELRMLLLVGMLVCAFGENLLVYGLDLYHFAPTPHPPSAIPPFVIMGRGYALWTAAVLGAALTRRVGGRAAFLWLLATSLAVFLVRLGWARDLWGGAWIVFYGLVLLATTSLRDRTFFAGTFVISTALELVGVGLGAWEWHPRTYWFEPTLPLGNPPAAVGAIHAAGGWLTLLVIRRMGLLSPPGTESRREPA